MSALQDLQRLFAIRARNVARRFAGDTEDFDPGFHPHAAKVFGYTMTSVHRQHALYEAVKFVVANKIPGSFVECGVYRGGSSLLAALAFSEFGDRRDLWLYDTFAGMTPPTEFDSKRNLSAERTVEHFEKSNSGDHNEWCFASLDDVKACLALANYPTEKVHYVVGDVSKTLLDTKPGQIAILRLDTDFYDSTKAELEQLYDLLSPGGILIIDDYGSWDGARKAVDEYNVSLSRPLFLARIDETCRIAQKQQTSFFQQTYKPAHGVSRPHVFRCGLNNRQRVV